MLTRNYRININRCFFVCGHILNSDTSSSMRKTLAVKCIFCLGGSFVSGGGGTLCSTTEVLQIHVRMKALHRPGIVLQKGTGDLSQGPLLHGSQQ